jgi:hypothetical protein
VIVASVGGSNAEIVSSFLKTSEMCCNFSGRIVAPVITFAMLVQLILSIFSELGRFVRGCWYPYSTCNFRVVNWGGSWFKG